MFYQGKNAVFGGRNRSNKIVIRVSLTQLNRQDINRMDFTQSEMKLLLNYLKYPQEEVNNDLNNLKYLFKFYVLIN